jgi:hypothetical protein
MKIPGSFALRWDWLTETLLTEHQKHMTIDENTGLTKVQN